MRPKRFSTSRGGADRGCLTILVFIVLLSWLATHSLASLAVWGLLALAALAPVAGVIWLGFRWTDARRRRREAAAPKPAARPAPKPMPARPARMDLDPSQVAAVRARAPRTLVVGGPGTGKTEVVARWAVGLIAEGVDPAEVLILTPNLRAAKAMRQRTLQILAELPEPKAPPTVGTLLTVAEALFREDPVAFGLTPGFTILSEYDSAQLWQTVLEELAFPCRDYVKEARSLRSIVANSKHRGEFLEAMLIERFGDRASEYSAVCKRYADRERELNRLDSEEVLKLWWDRMATNPATLDRLREKHPRVAVDDFQNCSPLEARVLARWNPTQLFVTGDDDQAIGRVRGAPPGRLQKFSSPTREKPEEHDCPNEPPDVVRLTLDFNHRATTPLIHFANDVLNLARPSARPLRAAPSAHDSDPEPRLVSFYAWSNPEREAAAAYDWFRNLLVYGEKPADLCVLARSPADLRPLIKLLKRNNFSYDYQDPNSHSLMNVPEPGYQDDKLTLASIHSAAGREWKHVLLMGMGDRQMPAPKGDPEEEQRLCYVAATRAKQSLTCFYPQYLPKLFQVIPGPWGGRVPIGWTPQAACQYLPLKWIKWDESSLT